jgi:DNA-directed RNA polymerase specialized sigma24 family protein
MTWQAQVFLVAFERRPTFRAGTTDVRPWLYGIATNFVRNNRRAERRFLAAMGRLSGGRDVLLETESATSADDLAEVTRALAALNQTQRDALLSLLVWFSPPCFGNFPLLPIGQVSRRAPWTATITPSGSS